MAYERISDKEKVKGDSLDAFVSTLAQTFRNQMAIRNADDELKFNEMVLDGNLTLEDQLQYRKDQLKRVSDDPSERRRVRGEISNLKDRIEQDTFTKDYTAKLTDFQAGVVSIDNVIQFLKDQRASSSDQNIRNTIDAKLLEMAEKKFSLTQDLIKNNTNYAVNSKAVDLIESQLSKVQGYRAQALLTGNDQLVSIYDLQIQSLTSAKSAAKVTNNILQLGAVSATGAFSAIAMLDALNNNISSAVSSGPVTINGTQYASEKDFWTFKRDAYLTDSSSNGFFPSLSTEVKDDINTANSKNTLNPTALSNLTAVYGTLGSRPELANFQKQIDIYKQDSMQVGANSISQSIVNRFNQDLDVGKAVSELTALKGMGVNVENAYTSILTSNASTKNAQVQGILSAAQNAMANDPNLTPEAAVAQAVAAGAGTVVSPTDAAGKTEKEIATSAVTTAAQNKGATDPRTTVPVAPTEPANTPNANGNISTATLLGLPNLQPGMRSDDVKTLQNYLIQQGYQIPSGATGFYGPETTAAVKALQEKFGVENSTGVGFFGPRTKAGLGTNQPATTVTPAPAQTPVVNQQPTPQPTAAAAPTPAPSAPQAGPANYANDPDYLKVKAGTVGQAGSFGRTPGGIVYLPTGTLLK